MSIPVHSAVNKPFPSVWKQYEWLIAQMLSKDGEIHTNRRIKGKLSGSMRQIDLVIEHEDGSMIIIDCKKRGFPINVKAVEEFAGLVRDVGASSGVIISSEGFTQGAGRRAEAEQNIRLRTVSWEEAYNTADREAIPNTMVDFCGNCWESNDEVLMNRIIWYGPWTPVRPDGIFMVFFAGKCIRCEAGQLHCDDCGISTVMTDDKIICPHCGTFYSTFSKLLGYKVKQAKSRRRIRIDTRYAGAEIAKIV